MQLFGDIRLIRSLKATSLFLRVYWLSIKNIISSICVNLGILLMVKVIIFVLILPLDDHWCVSTVLIFFFVRNYPFMWIQTHWRSINWPILFMMYTCRESLTDDHETLITYLHKSIVLIFKYRMTIVISMQI